MSTPNRTVIACAAAMTATLLAARARVPRCRSRLRHAGLSRHYGYRSPLTGTTAHHHPGTSTAAASQETLAYRHQLTGNGSGPKDDTFAIFATGTGPSATSVPCRSGSPDLARRWWRSGIPVLGSPVKDLPSG